VAFNKIMRCLLVLTALAALLPIYGQEKSTPSSSHTNKASEPKQPGPKTQPTPSSAANVNVINQQPSAAQENGPREHPQGYLSRLVAPENLLNIALVVAGFIGICVAIKTLRALKLQARIMARQTALARMAAETAKDNVELIIKKERATLAFDLSDIKWHNPPVPPFNSAISGATYKILFFGYTPAYIVDSSVWVFVDTSKEPPNEPTRSPIAIPKIISSNMDMAAQTAPIWPLFFEPEQLEAIRKGLSFIHFHGYIKYRDQFDKQRQTTIKCRWEESDIVGLNGEWVPYGKPEDNQQT
jgi:hypothetical protein